MLKANVVGHLKGQSQNTNRWPHFIVFRSAVFESLCDIHRFHIFFEVYDGNSGVGWLKKFCTDSWMLWFIPPQCSNVFYLYASTIYNYFAAYLILLWCSFFQGLSLGVISKAGAHLMTSC